MPKREPGLDLLRCIAFLFVVTFHSFLNNGYYSEPQTGVAMWLAGSFRWLSVSCIGLFLMLTGYLKSGKTDVSACYRGLVPVLLGYFLAAVISIPVRHFLFGDIQTLGTWLARLFGFTAVYYGWYVEMYIGLVLLSPFVNLLLRHLQSAKGLLGLGIVMLILTALPGATPWVVLPDYWRSIYPLTYYILGAIVRRLQPKLNFWLAIAGAVMMAAVLGAATVLSTDGKLSEALTWEFPDLWVVFLVVFLFVALYRVRIPAALRPVLAFCASGCYGGYLLSHLFDAWCYKLVPAWHTPAHYALVFFCITVPIFMVSLLPGALLEGVKKRSCPNRKGASKCLR
ncbi:MAG: acyltransferase family protein [Oscillospiraceae bacterium]|nr:acyltransferase family protein [Oscillospiraceae bacterium]